ncbi:MAG TPA: VOC family protein [Mucilaginibacter sp.]|jgi:catechol 2,3-dioxygenase-like lactoylglutathione lyase family enzyme|nr:VOC family protein [Mucilaginibacter sp.]
MITFKRVDHINISVPPERLEEAFEFYSEVLGLEQIDRPDKVFGSKGYWFNIGDIQLHISCEKPLPRSTRHTAFEVTDIAAARTQLEKYGVEITEEPVLPGRNRFAFIDPFGNRMELLEIV